MRRRLFAAFGCLFLAALCFMSGPYLELVEAMKPVGTFDEAPVRGVADVNERLLALGPDAGDRLLRHVAFDVPFLLFQFLALSFFVGAFTGLRPIRRRLLLVPVALAALADLVEDAAIVAVVRAHGGAGVGESLVDLLALATRTKLALLPFAGGAVVIALALFLADRVRRRGEDQVRYSALMRT